MRKSAKPKLVFTEGYWAIVNWTECLETTTLNTKERWFVHLALSWIKKMHNRSSAIENKL